MKALTTQSLKIWKAAAGVFIVAFVFMSAGCIHEYPYATNNPTKPPGQDPSKVYASLEVNFELTWETLLHQVTFSNEDGSKSRDARNNPHRFIIEVKEGTTTLCRDIRYLSDSDFSSGKLLHPLSRSLEAKEYELAVWYDFETDDGEQKYETTNLENIRHLDLSTTEAEYHRCAFAYEYLDLREYDSEKSQTQEVVKSFQLKHAAARFEIVATDVNDFISQQKEALEQGDTFTAHVTLSDGGFDNFNLYSGHAWKENEHLDFSGRMRLPFAEYEELKIAEGVFFCGENEQEVKARLSVVSSSLVTAAQTDWFTFPAKRGRVTVVKGDFLTKGVDGMFSINSIWDGEIDFSVEEGAQ